MCEISSRLRKLACYARRSTPLWRNTPVYLGQTTQAGSRNCCSVCHLFVRSVSSAWSICSFSSSSARSGRSKTSSRRCLSHHRILRNRRCAASWGTPICEKKQIINQEEEKDDERENRSHCRVEVILIRDVRQFLYCDCASCVCRANHNIDYRARWNLLTSLHRLSLPPPFSPSSFSPRPVIYVFVKA